MRVLISAVFLILLYIESSQAIRCIECNSHERQDCNDEFHLTDKNQDYSKDCGENVTACRKIIQEVYIINDWKEMKGDWNTRIVRQCAPTVGKLDCIDRTGTYRVKIKHCHCNDKPNCNGSSHIHTSILMIVTSLFISIGLFMSKFL